MKTGEGTLLAEAGSVTSWLTLTANPFLSFVASVGTIILTGFLIYKAILDIKRHNDRENIQKP